MKAFRRTGKNREPEDQRIVMEKDPLERVQSYAAKEEERFRMTTERTRVLLCGVMMMLILFLSFFCVSDLTNHDFSLATFGHAFIRRFNDLFDLITGNHLQSGILNFLCTFLTAVLCGIGLATSGCCYQAVFHNPMASPTMLGVESGGSLGVTIYVMFFSKPSLGYLMHLDYEGFAMEYYAMSIFQRYGQYFATFIGCMVVVFITLFLTKKTGRDRIQTVPLLVGGSVFTIAVNSIIQVVEYYMVITHQNTTLLIQLQSVSTGRYQGISTPLLLFFFSIPLLAGFVLMLIFARRLNIIALGREEAKLMGVDIERDRILRMILSTLMTAAVVSFCGTIGFIGLIIPHLARKVVGNDFRHLIPASACLGAIFMLIAYDLSYMTRMLLDTSVIINTLGGIVFTVTMVRNRRQNNADWA